MCPPLISSSASEDTSPMIKPFTHNLKTVFTLFFLFYKKRKKRIITQTGNNNVREEKVCLQNNSGNKCKLDI